VVLPSVPVLPDVDNLKFAMPSLPTATADIVCRTSITRLLVTRHRNV